MVGKANPTTPGGFASSYVSGTGTVFEHWTDGVTENEAFGDVRCTASAGNKQAESSQTGIRDEHPGLTPNLFPFSTLTMTHEYTSTWASADETIYTHSLISWWFRDVRISSKPAFHKLLPISSDCPLWFYLKFSLEPHFPLGCERMVTISPTGRRILPA